jgi:hypothetical protein
LATVLSDEVILSEKESEFGIMSGVLSDFFSTDKNQDSDKGSEKYVHSPSRDSKV